MFVSLQSKKNYLSCCGKTDIYLAPQVTRPATNEEQTR